MSDKLTAVSEYEHLGLIGVALAVGSLILAYYYFRKSQKTTVLSCIMYSNNILRNRRSLFPELAVHYGDTPLEDLTVTKIYIRNSGTKEIRRTDIAPADPIRVSARSGTKAILDIGIEHQSNSANNVRIVESNDSTYIIDFDFMSAKDAVLLQVLHMGTDSTAISVHGTVMGADKPFVGSSPHDVSEMMAKSNLRFVFRHMDVTILAFALIIAFIFWSFGYLIDNLILSIIMWIIAAFFAWAGIKFLWARIRRKPSDELDRQGLFRAAFVQMISYMGKPTDPTTLDEDMTDVPRN